MFPAASIQRVGCPSFASVSRVSKLCVCIVFLERLLIIVQNFNLLVRMSISDRSFVVSIYSFSQYVGGDWLFARFHHKDDYSSFF